MQALLGGPQDAQCDVLWEGCGLELGCPLESCPWEEGEAGMDRDWAFSDVQPSGSGRLSCSAVFPGVLCLPLCLLFLVLLPPASLTPPASSPLSFLFPSLSISCFLSLSLSISLPQWIDGLIVRSIYRLSTHPSIHLCLCLFLPPFFSS